METEQNQDYSVPFTRTSPNPKGIRTAQDATKGRETFEEFQYVSQAPETVRDTEVNDYSRTTMFRDVFNNPEFRNAMLNAKYTQHNIDRLNYYSKKLNVSKDSLLEQADKGNLIDDLISTDNDKFDLDRERLKRNVLNPFPVLKAAGVPGSREALPSKENEDFRINQALDYMFKNPLSMAGEDKYAFSVIYEDENNDMQKYTIPTFQQTEEASDIDETGVGIKTQPAFAGIFDRTQRSPKEETQRYFKLLKNMGLDEVKIAEFMWAERNGMLEQYRRKHGVSDLIKLVPFILRGIGEAVNDASVEVNNYFKDKVRPIKYIGDYVEPNIDTSGESTGVTKFGAELFSEKTDGAVSVDSANAILAYSPDFKTMLKREGYIGLAAYAVTGGGGFVMGQIKSGSFRNWAKKTFNSKTFEDALKVANKKGMTDSDIFEQYWQENTIGFFKNFRKSMTIASMRMAQEAKGIIFEKDRVRVQFLKTRLDNANSKYTYLSGERAKGNITQEALDKQAKIVARIERNIEWENVKALIPESYRGLAKDEMGVALGIASVNHYYQMNSVDPENLEPNWFLMLLGGVSGVYSTEIGTRGIKGTIRSLADNFNYFLRKDFATASKVGKARNVYKWLSLASPQIQEQVFKSIDSHNNIAQRLLGLSDVNGDPLITNPDAFKDASIKIVSLIGLRNAGEQLLDTVKHSDIRTMSDTFQKFLINQKDKVNLYNELSDTITQLRKARLHPDMEADQVSKQIITNYIAMYDEYGRYLLDLEKKANKFAQQTENELTDMIDGLKANPDTFKPDVFSDYNTKLESLSNFYIQQNILDGFNPDEAVKKANETLDKFNIQINKNLESVDSLIQTVPISSNALVAGSANLQNKYKSVAGGKFLSLKENYGSRSATPVFMDATEFYGLIKNFDAPKFEQYFEATETFGADLTRGARKVQDIKPGVLPNKLQFLFNDAADKYIENILTKNLLSEDETKIKSAINLLKEENTDISSFEIWKTLYEQGYDNVTLPIGFDDWKAVANTMSSGAFKKLGTLQGKENYSMYEFWVDLAEDELNGFSKNFFNEGKESVFEEGVAEQIMLEWKEAKGAWQDWASRYKSGYGEKWNKIKGKDPKGGVIYNTPPEKWVSEIAGRLSNKLINKDEANQLISDLGQAFGGVNITQGNIAQWGFDTRKKSMGLNLVRKLLLRSSKQVLLNSPSGKELATSLLSKNIIKPGDLAQLKGTENFQILLKNIELLEGVTGQKIISRAEVEEGFNVHQLLAYSDKFKNHAKRVKKDVQTEVNTILGDLKKRQATIFGGLETQKNKLLEKIDPKYIHDQVQLGEQGLAVLDQTRLTYSNLILDQLGVKNVVDLNSMQTKNYEALMKEYDRAIAGRLMEHIDTISKASDPTSVPTIGIEPVSGTVNVETSDLVKGEVMLKAMGNGEAWQKTFRDLIKRGSVDGTDSVFNDYLTIAGYMTGENSSKIPFTIQGIPNSLSMASWISRAYAWQRGIIGTRWLATEAAIHAIRKGQYGMFQEMMENPEIGTIVVKMLEEGTAPSFKDKVRLEKAFISIIARNQAQAQGNEDSRTKELNEYSKNLQKNIKQEDKKSRRKNIEKQMEEISKKQTVPSVTLDKIGKEIGRRYDSVKESFGLN